MLYEQHYNFCLVATDPLFLCGRLRCVLHRNMRHVEIIRGPLEETYCGRIDLFINYALEHITAQTVLTPSVARHAAYFEHAAMWSGPCIDMTPPPMEVDVLNRRHPGYLAAAALSRRVGLKRMVEQAHCAEKEKEHGTSTMDTR